MEKGQTASNSVNISADAPMPSAPPLMPSPPSAPPSYEEAVAADVVRVPIADNNPYPMIYQPSAQTLMPVPPITNAIPYAAPSPVIQQQHQEHPPLNSMQPQAPNVRVIHQTVSVLGPNPIKMNCPSCHADIKTTTMSDHQPSAHICCIVLCIIGCCLCSCLPYCLSAFMSVHHFCPSCKAYIGTWKG